MIVCEVLMVMLLVLMLVLVLLLCWRDCWLVRGSVLTSLGASVLLCFE